MYLKQKPTKIMARKAILFLYVTGFCMFMSLITLPLVSGSEDSRNCYKGPHVVISSGLAKGQCYDCSHHLCPEGSGLRVECAGQNISGDVNIDCVACVAGVNFSATNDYSQCQPCPIICTGQNVSGKCETGGDYRKCVNCSKGSYFNKTDDTCSPCLCHNMSKELEEICLENGFDFETNCSKSEPTSHSSVTTEESEKHWPVRNIIGVSLAVFIFILYCCLVLNNLRKFLQQESHCPSCLKEILQVFCWCHSTRIPFASDNPGENGSLLECRKEKLTVDDLNAETFEKLCKGFSVNGVLNRNFDQLAGRLGYNVKEATEFKEHKDNTPVKTMLLTWGETKGNNILRLQAVLKAMGREDLDDDLEGELNEHHYPCSKCENCAV